MKYFTIFWFFNFCLVANLCAQSPDLENYVTIKNINNQYFTGDLILITSDSILIYNSKDGLLSFSKSTISTFINGKLSSEVHPTTNSSVPYYVQSAIPNGRGSHYYKNYYIFGNEFNFGLSERLNLSVGFESASLILNSGSRFPTLQLGSKYSIPITSELYTGLSVKYYFNGEGSAIMLATPLTLGNERTNFTVSPTLLSADESKRIGVFSNLSVALSLKNRFVLDYIRIDGVGLAAMVIEHLYKSGFSLSLGVLLTPDNAIPNLSFSIPFGYWKSTSIH